MRSIRASRARAGAPDERRARGSVRAVIPALELRELRVSFAAEGGRVQALDGLSLRIEAGSTLGLVGESGSGKSACCLAILGLLPRGVGRVDGGEVLLTGRSLAGLGEAQWRALRGREIAMVFQDPHSALNPHLPIGLQLTEVLELHLGLARREARRRAAHALGEVGLPQPEERLASYPHQLSGGQRQRVMIAMALSCAPKVLLADEPTTALDAAVQVQILDLLRSLQHKHGTAILLVTHSLGVVARVADEVLVLYAGRAAEHGRTRELLAHPLHPYTRALLASVPSLRGDPRVPLAAIGGQPPDLAHTPPGCAFAPRCAKRVGACETERPTWAPSAHLPARELACHHPELAP